MEAPANEQTVPRASAIVFDPDSDDSEGNNIELSADGRVFTIHQTGLYHIEWTVNLAPGDYQIPAVVGILENSAPASGASCSAAGSFSSGTLIYVDTTPFTITLFNYEAEITLAQHGQYEDSAASIRILRFADGPS